VAWAHAPVRFAREGSTVTVHNEQPAGVLDVTVRWSLVEVDRTLRSGGKRLRLAPGATVTLDPGGAPPNPQDRERWLRLEAVGRDGVRYGWDQFAAGGRVVPGVAQAPPPKGPRLAQGDGAVVVAGDGWTYRFDTATGTLTSMSARGRELLRTGPELDVYRPPTSNETYGWGTADREVWHELGLDRLTTAVTGVSASTVGGAAVVEVRATATGRSGLLAFDQVLRYRIDGRGTITLDHRVAPRGSRLGALPYLPRVGVRLRVPDSMDRFAFYGKGPQETYNDRSSGALTGVWRDTVDGQYVRYSRPQAYGNHTGARWATLHDGRGGLLVGGDIDVSVTPYDELARAEYDFQLPLVRNDGWVTLHAAAGETGMGETPNSVLDEFRVSPTRVHEYSLVIRPLTGAEVRAGGVPDSGAQAPCPPDVAVAAGEQITPGEPHEVAVTVSARCAGGAAGTTAALAAPAGWTVTPTTADLGTVAYGTPERAVFSVTTPPGTDAGRYDLTATVTATTNGFPTTASATATVRAPLPPGGLWVSDLPFLVAENGWGPVERDMSNAEQPAGDGRPITIGGVVYEKGIGAHATSRVVVDLGGRCTSFRADVGVDDEMGASGSVAFEVWVDGERRAATGVLTGAAGPEPVTADVTGGARLELRITDGGNGNGADHGDWAAARLLCSP
jgi:beta-galactosidase